MNYIYSQVRPELKYFLKNSPDTDSLNPVSQEYKDLRDIKIRIRRVEVRVLELILRQCEQIEDLILNIHCLSCNIRQGIDLLESSKDYKKEIQKFHLQQTLLKENISRIRTPIKELLIEYPLEQVCARARVPIKYQIIEAIILKQEEFIHGKSYV